MALTDFNRGKGPGSSAVQRYIDTNFPVCPICADRTPNWMLKTKTEVIDGSRMQFRCSACESILSITSADLLGLSKHSSNLLFALYLAPVTAINATSKVLKGKKVTTTYIKIERIGAVNATPFEKGQEIPIDALQKYISTL